MSGSEEKTIPEGGKENLVQVKSYAFAVRVVNLYKDIISRHREYALGKQILRAGTSIGANVEETIGAQSDRDFVAKLSIAYKEAREASYWLRLLHDTGYLQHRIFQSMSSDCEELKRLLYSIINTSRKKLAN